jgi:DNA-directed RNA polymerase specialized sigma24 family protein
MAWQRFADLYVPLVYDWMRRAGLRPSDALDVTQNVFLSVARSQGGFAPAQSEYFGGKAR